jgi:hypothetical protein
MYRTARAVYLGVGGIGDLVMKSGLMDRSLVILALQYISQAHPFFQHSLPWTSRTPGSTNSGSLPDSEAAPTEQPPTRAFQYSTNAFLSGTSGPKIPSSQS